LPGTSGSEETPAVHSSSIYQQRLAEEFRNLAISPSGSEESSDFELEGISDLYDETTLEIRPEGNAESEMLEEEKEEKEEEEEEEEEGSSDEESKPKEEPEPKETEEGTDAMPGTFQSLQLVEDFKGKEGGEVDFEDFMSSVKMPAAT
jgi:hypothetical protein